MWWRAYLVVLCACGAAAQREQESLAARGGRVRERDSKSDEPTCDQLKAMWRFSKRQARAPEILNEVSSYRDPLEVNMWPVYTAMPRAAPRFRYQPYALPRDSPSYGRLVTKAPPNVVRTPDFSEKYGYLNLPRPQEANILRTSQRTRPQSAFMIPPQRDRFDQLRNEIRKERQLEIERMFEAEHKAHLKQLASGHGGEDYGYGEMEGRGMQNIEFGDDSPPRHALIKPKSQGSRQYSRYSDMQVPVRRTFYHPYFQLAAPELPPYPY